MDSDKQTASTHEPPSMLAIRLIAFLAVVAFGVNRGFACDHWMPAIGGVLAAMPLAFMVLATLEFIGTRDRGDVSAWLALRPFLLAIVMSVGLAIAGSVTACATIELRIGAAERVGDRFLVKAQSFYDTHGRWPTALAELGIEESERHAGSFTVDYFVFGEEPIVQFELRVDKSDWHLLPQFLVANAAVRWASNPQWRYRSGD